MNTATETFELRREALLARLERAKPQMLALVAPAGFGKSTLTRQFVAQNVSWAVCDCSGLRDDLDLARRLIPTLARLAPEREQSLTQRELMLSDGGTPQITRVNLALQSWREPGGGTVIFENAESLAASVSGRDFFAQILGQRPRGRNVIICSREPLRLHLTRFAAPHEIVTLRAQDLAFDMNDLQAIFGNDVPNASALERIMSVCQGWPIAVLLLKRFAAEGRISDLLDRLDDVAFEELHDYLADEVLASLDVRMQQAIFTIACIPHASVQDLLVANFDDEWIAAVDGFARASAFVNRNDDGSFSVHPLLSALLTEHQEQRRDELLRSVAAAYEAATDYQRAAELHLARGDQQAAARVLGQHEVVRDHAPSMQYARVLSSLDAGLIARFPRLWGVTALLRLFCASPARLLDEAESIWRTLSPDVQPLERYYILVFRVLFMSYLGMFEEALAILESFSRNVQLNDPPQNLLDGYVLYLRGLLRARMGHLSQAERDLQMSLSTVEEMDVMASGAFLTLGADIARVRGERAAERQLLERAIVRARPSALENFVAFVLAEMFFGAWFAGEHAAAAEHALQLEQLVDHAGAHGFSYFTAAARSRAAEPVENDMPKYVALGRLIALSRAFDEQEARRLAQSALTVAQQYRSPFVETLAAIACAFSDEANAQKFMQRALAAAAKCDSPALQSAVDCVARGEADAGMLTAFVAHVSRQRGNATPPIEIEVARARVSVDGVPVTIAGRELELLIAIALQRQATPRETLAAMLWPDIEEYASRNSISVCLHRLRRHLKRDDAIVRELDGYRLHADASVDLWDFERLTASLRGRERLTEQARGRLQRARERLNVKRPARMQRWEWFEPVERRLGELRSEISSRLASDALEAGSAGEALAYASEMIAYDPCDEPAREIAIRAHLLLGDRAAALRQFRQYRDTLRAELQCEPSQALSALLSA
jgi:DNA-binding SARP family transcriptional activator